MSKTNGMGPGSSSVSQSGFGGVGALEVRREMREQRWWRRLAPLALAGAALALGVLAGCGGGDDSTSTSSSTASGDTTAAAEGGNAEVVAAAREIAEAHKEVTKIGPTKPIEGEIPKGKK